MRVALPLGVWAASCVAFAPRALAKDAVSLHDTSVVIDHMLIQGAEASAYVAVARSDDLDHSEPVAGAKVALALVSTSEKAPRRHDVASITTDATGAAHVRFSVPELDPGAYKLVVRTRSPHGEDTVERAVTVSTSVVVHLRTDRPVYRAGQTLRWRATILSAADAHPKRGAPVELSIADPRGTKIWSGRVVTDEVGMVSGALPLGDDLILGGYTLSARADGASASERVQVREFVLPPFTVEIVPEVTGPVAGGAKVRGRVVARYAYGEPVAGELRFRAGSDEQAGTLDAEGRWRFEVVAPLDADALPLSATVTDGAGRTRTATADVAMHSDRLELALVPERRDFVAGENLDVTIVTTDGRGNFVPARVFLQPGRGARQGGPSNGVSRLTLATGARDYSLHLTATAVTDDGRTATSSVYLYRRHDGASVRVREAVVKSGDPIRVEGKWSSIRGPLVATLIRGGAPVASAIAKVEGGAFHAELVAPDGVFGLATVRVIDVGFDPTNGEMPRTTAQATVFVRPARLDVAVRGETRHAPGSDVKLAVSVTDADGRPVEGAGLAASVVDERVLALGEPRPDLGRILDELDVSKARAAGIAFVDLLGRAEREPANARWAMRAIVESLPPDPAIPLVRSDAAERVRSELDRLTEAQAPVYRVLLTDPNPIGSKVGATWEFASELHVLLERAKWKRERRETPWRRPTTWAYARKLVPSWTFGQVAHEIAEERLDRLVTRLRALGKNARLAVHKDPSRALRKLADRGSLSAYLIVDPWGGTIRAVRHEYDEGVAWIGLESAGPDGVYDTLDDLDRVDVFLEQPGLGLRGTGVGGGGYGVGSGRGGMSGRASGAPAVRMGQAIEPAVAVRQRFDETVLWVTGIRTAADGLATLEVPLADSVTGWKVEVEAVSPRGAVGTSTARLETFLPLHVDADAPAALTRGDRYSISVIVANHGGRARSLSIDAKTQGSIRLVDAARHTIDLPSGATRALSFPVSAHAIGAGSIEITLSDGGRAIDAMKRGVRVDPPGSIVREIRSGALAKGTSTLELAVPANALAATTMGRLRVFRGAADQAIDGLESLLSEPNGCFEQTSSSTHPNLLVLDLLRDHRGAEAIRKRAEEYVARGYQRLVSYEVSGGGFSWFGESPANQVLTAYGLLEFKDMSRVYPVDPELIARTRKWLLGKQRRDGSWKPDEHWLHDWSAVQGTVSTTAYVAWALAEAGERGGGLAKALAFLRANESALAKDPYLLALWAGAEAAGGGKPSRPLERLREFATRERDELRFRSAGRTLFYSKGTGADVQVTALAATALARAGKRSDAVEAVAWVWGAREDGGWDSTQGIVMALRAAASMQSREPPRGGTIDVAIAGRVVGKLDLDGDGVPTVELPNLAPGTHAITLSGVPDGLLYDLRLTYREDGEPAPETRGIEVVLEPLARDAKIGESIPISIRLRNPGTESVPMPTVVVPVPPGFRASTPSLKALVSKRRVSKFEDLGSEVHLYLTELAPGSESALVVEWEAVAECDVLQRAAIAYAYYDPATRGSSAVARLSATSRRADASRGDVSPEPPPPPPPRTAVHRPPVP